MNPLYEPLQMALAFTPAIAFLAGTLFGWATLGFVIALADGPTDEDLGYSTAEADCDLE